jgi:excisionase family DNA binding protein
VPDVAMLSPFGPGIMLDRRGAEIVAAAIETTILHARQCRGGLVKIPDDVAEVLEVAGIAARESAAGPETITVTPVVARSEPGAVGMQRADDHDSSLGGPPLGNRRLSTAEVAKIVGVGEHSITKACRQGRIRAERLGRVWTITDRDAREYAERRNRA